MNPFDSCLEIESGWRKGSFKLKDFYEESKTTLLKQVQFCRNVDKIVISLIR